MGRADSRMWAVSVHVFEETGGQGTTHCLVSKGYEEEETMT